ncbi:MAG TPA: signal peptidase I [Saprospiraceae bacterium]|nr:signal peptidase I [Saprospiraceae bacterium]
MAIFIFLIVSYLLLSVSLYLLFPKAGVEAKKGLIPGVNFVEWCKIIGKNPKEALWLLFPIVNIFTFAGMAVDMMRSFGKDSFGNAAAAVIYAPAAFFQLAKGDAKYEGPILHKENAFKEEVAEAIKLKDQYKLNKLSEQNPFKKPVWREWTESIIFAVFAAAFIRMFLIEAYVIPTPSMEGSLNVGDYLFVSKAHYGIRTPKTVAMIPLLHNTIPGLGTESYLEKPNLPFFRLPAIEKIESGKPIVFNWPVGDSIYLTKTRSYFVGQERYNPSYLLEDPELKSLVDNKKIITRPVDKEDHYIKRCIGVGGDKIQIINRQVFVNDVMMKNPTHLQFLYRVFVPNSVNVNVKKFAEWGIDRGDMAGSDYFFLDSTQVNKIKSLNPEVKVEIYSQQPEPGKLFPFDSVHFGQWTVDNFGPLTIPKKGMTIKLSPQNIALYRRAISVYEHNVLVENGDKYTINGQVTDSYTFKQDYFWAMGDNRHNSEDSRMWGFVPHENIVGKPLFIWFSKDENGINWDRIFKYAGSKD